LQEVWETKDTHIPKKRMLIWLGIICWEFVVELEGSLMQERDQDSHKGDV